MERKRVEGKKKVEDGFDYSWLMSRENSQVDASDVVSRREGTRDSKVQ